MRNTGYFILFILAFWAACTKDVNIGVQPYDSKLSIQGLITPGQTPKVYLYRTVAFFDPNVLPADLFVRDATVTLATPDGSEVLFQDSSWNAYRCHYEYHYSGSMPIQAGKAYTLSVSWNGEVFSASATTSQRVVQPDSVTYTPAFKDLYGEHEGVVLHFKDPVGTGEYYRFAMGRTFTPTDTIFGTGKEFSACALGQTTWLEEIGRSIYPDQNADGTAFTITVEPTYKHKQGKVSYVRLQSMDKASYEFFDQFDRQKLAQFNPFVEPVFILPGQFGARAIGVFGAYAVSDSVQFVYPE